MFRKLGFSKLSDINQRNPMKYLVYFALFGLLIDIGGIYMDTSAKDFASINPLAPLRIVCLLTFLYLYVKQSKYAWHVIMAPMLLYIPIYWLLRVQGIHFQQQEFATKDLITLAAWLVMLLYMIAIRSQYMDFLTSKDKEEL